MRGQLLLCASAAAARMLLANVRMHGRLGAPGVVWRGRVLQQQPQRLPVGAGVPPVLPRRARQACAPGVRHLHNGSTHVAVHDEPLDAVGLQQLQELGVGEPHVAHQTRLRHLAACGRLEEGSRAGRVGRACGVLAAARKAQAASSATRQRAATHSWHELRSHTARAHTTSTTSRQAQRQPTLQPPARPGALTV